MKLYLLRHGKADWPDWPDWTGSDDERPLTAEGIDDMRLVGAGLKRLKIEPALILTSPLPRAVQTAEIAAKALGIPMKQAADLAPGFERRKLTPLLAANAGDLMLVGHEPDFSRLIRSLTGGRVKLSRAAIACIETGDELPDSRLLWLLPSKSVIRLLK
jgi:phosphohistidine phosphatase